MSAPRYEIHVVGRDLVARKLQREAGLALLELDTGRLATLDELAPALFEMLEVPVPGVGRPEVGLPGAPMPGLGLDAVISLAVDIDAWMPATAGWIAVIRGLDSSPTDLAGSAADIWPPIIDRWRSRADRSFVAVLIARERRALVLDALRRENLRLRRSGERPDAVTHIGPVPVYVDGVLDRDVSAGAS